MGNIRLCCGHWIDDFDNEVRLYLKTYSRECERVVSYGGYCKKCAKEYEEMGVILHNEQEQEDWIRGITPDPEMLP